MATQVCDRLITYRNFDYARAETIIQDEEYLEDEDYDDIRLYRRNANILEGIENAKEKYAAYNSTNFYNDHHREKRETIVGDNIVIPWYVQEKLNKFMCIEANKTIVLPDVSPQRKKRAETGSKVTYSVDWGCIMIKLITIITGACAATGCLTPESPRIDTPDVPKCPGDPNCPRTPSILDLVPPGLVPVAEFPPFRNPFRTVNAEAVIFREEEGTLPNQQVTDDGRGGIPFRKKRNAGYCPQKSLFDRIALFVRCYKPRMERRLRQNSHSYGSYGKKKRDTSFYGYNQVATCPGNCGTVADCFDEPCPRYGARVKYTYTIPRNAGGQYYNGGETDDIKRYYDQLTERQLTGEGFRSRAPPDCRTIAG